MSEKTGYDTIREMTEAELSRFLTAVADVGRTGGFLEAYEAILDAKLSRFDKYRAARAVKRASYDTKYRNMFVSIDYFSEIINTEYQADDEDFDFVRYLTDSLEHLTLVEGVED